MLAKVDVALINSGTSDANLHIAVLLPLPELAQAHDHGAPEVVRLLLLLEKDLGRVVEAGGHEKPHTLQKLILELKRKISLPKNLTKELQVRRGVEDAVELTLPLVGGEEVTALVDTGPRFSLLSVQFLHQEAWA